MKTLSRYLVGALAAIAVFCGAAYATNTLTSNTGTSIYFGWNPLTGLEISHGADVSGGVVPAVTVTGSSCTITATTGGASTGTFVETGGTSCAFTITFPSAAPNGWDCYVNDLTTPADGPAKAASTTTTTWVSGTTTVVTADTLQYTCVGY